MHKKPFFNKDNFQFLAILLMFGYIISLKQCQGDSAGSQAVQPKIDTIATIDTTPPRPIIIRLPRQEIPQPIIVYVDSSGRTVPTAKIDTSKHEIAQLYKDSIEDDNLTLYYESTIKGQLLKNALDYKLKVPKLITKKIEISKPYPVPVSALFLSGGIGGNVSQFSSITVGLNFVSAKGWSLGYDYDILQNTHNVKLGVKLFSLSKKQGY